MRSRTMTTALAIAALVLSAGCAKKPELTDIQQHLTSTLDKDAPYRVGPLTVETESGAEGKVVVKFKAELVTDELLYVRVGAGEELEKAGWKEAELDSAIESAAQLPADLAEKVEKAKPRRAADLVVLKRSVAANDKRVWYGTVDAKYLVDRWSFANLATEKRETFEGQKRASFPSDAIVLGSPEAPKAFEDAVAARKNYIEAIASAQAIVKERGLREDAEKQAAAEVQKEKQARAEAEARAAAEVQREKQVRAEAEARAAAEVQREKQVRAEAETRAAAEVEKQKQARAEAETRAAAEARSRQVAEKQADAARRKMPVLVEFQNAPTGRGVMAMVQNTSPGVLELNVTTGNGLKVTQIQVKPGSKKAIGWPQGPELRSGDILKLEHPYYLTAAFRVP